MARIYRDVPQDRGPPMREYYMGYNGKLPETTHIRGRGAEVSEDQGWKILRQLEGLGFPEFRIDEATAANRAGEDKQ